jgi:hypothetical protein
MKKLFLTFMTCACLMIGQAQAAPRYEKDLIRLSKVVRKYQHLFDMDNVTIALSMYNADQLQDPQSCGESLWQFINGVPMGVIHILARDQYGKVPGGCTSKDPKKDQVNTVVHELGHFIVNYAKNPDVIIHEFVDVIAPLKPVNEPPKKTIVLLPKVNSDPIFDDFPVHRQ